jgi:hypothetical protein
MVDARILVAHEAPPPAVELKLREILGVESLKDRVGNMGGK